MTRSPLCVLPRSATLLVATVAVWTVAVWSAPPATAQPDSVRAAILQERGLPPDHTPRRALWRGLALPGWGQFYNRQYYKLPFVYAGLAGIGYAIVWNNNRYLLYRHAHLYRLEEQQTPDAPNPFSQFQDDYDEVTQRVGGELSARQLREQRDRLRRWRDLSIVGAGLVYALTIVDAYVSAHLLTFDVDDRLAIRVSPSGRSGVAHATGPPASILHTVGAEVSVQVRF